MVFLFRLLNAHDSFGKEFFDIFEAHFSDEALYPSAKFKNEILDDGEVPENIPDSIHFRKDLFPPPCFVSQLLDLVFQAAALLCQFFFFHK